MRFEDWQAKKVYADCIGVGGNYAYLSGRGCPIPYGSLLPKKVDNLLAAGRCVAADNKMLNYTRLIAPCMLTGHAGRGRARAGGAGWREPAQHRPHGAATPAKKARGLSRMRKGLGKGYSRFVLLLALPMAATLAPPELLGAGPADPQPLSRAVPLFLGRAGLAFAAHGPAHDPADSVATARLLPLLLPARPPE